MDYVIAPKFEDGKTFGQKSQIVGIHDTVVRSWMDDIEKKRQDIVSKINNDYKTTYTKSKMEILLEESKKNAETNRFSFKEISDVIHYFDYNKIEKKHAFGEQDLDLEKPLQEIIANLTDQIEQLSKEKEQQTNFVGELEYYQDYLFQQIEDTQKKMLKSQIFREYERVLYAKQQKRQEQETNDIWSTKVDQYYTVKERRNVETAKPHNLSRRETILYVQQCVDKINDIILEQYTLIDTENVKATEPVMDEFEFQISRRKAFWEYIKRELKIAKEDFDKTKNKETVLKKCLNRHVQKRKRNGEDFDVTSYYNLPNASLVKSLMVKSDDNFTKMKQSNIQKYINNESKAGEENKQSFYPSELFYDKIEIDYSLVLDQKDPNIEYRQFLLRHLKEIQRFSLWKYFGYNKSLQEVINIYRLSKHQRIYQNQSQQTYLELSD